jgi:hypothetical protein
MAVEEKSENGLKNFAARPLSDWKQHRTVVESSVMRFCCSMQYYCMSLTRRSTRTISVSFLIWFIENTCNIYISK